MEKILILKNISQLLCCESSSNLPKSGKALSENKILENMSISISNKKIQAIDKFENLVKNHEFDEIECIDCSNKTVIPGFVDSHTHTVFNESREKEFAMRINGAAYLDILEAGGGILSSVKSIKNASVDELVEKAKARLETMFFHGTTTVEIKSGYGLSQEEEIKMLQVTKRLKEQVPMTIVSTYCAAHAIPQEHKANPQVFLDQCMEIMPEIKNNNLAEFNDIFIEKGVFTIDQGREYLLKGIENGLPAKFHADEIYPLGGAELAAEIGAVSADHLLAASIEGLKMMAKKNVVATYLPGTLYSLMSKTYPDFSTIQNTNVPMALASDYNPGSNFSFNMQNVISQAAFLMKAPVEAGLNMTTINGAHALQLGETKGSIEPGKDADILIMNIPSYLYLGYHYGTNMVSTIIKDGAVYNVPELSWRQK